MSICQPGAFVDVGNFSFLFVGTTDLGGGLVRWCWNITFLGAEGQPALSHWDIQACPQLTLAQNRQFTVRDVTGAPIVLFDTTDPTVIDDFIEFSPNFPDGFPVYGMKTEMAFTEEELGTTGETWEFCYVFDEGQVPLEPVPGFVAPKSGGGQALDAVGFGVCVPGCAGAAMAPRRGYGL